VGDGAFDELSITVIDQQFEAFELVAVDRSLPPQQSGAFVELFFEHVFAYAVPAARRISDRVGNSIATFERANQNRAVEHHIFGKQGSDLLDGRGSGFA